MMMKGGGRAREYDEKGEEGPGTRGERMMSSSSSFCRRRCCAADCTVPDPQNNMAGQRVGERTAQTRGEYPPGSQIGQASPPNCLSEGVIQATVEGVIQATAYPRESFRQLLTRGSHSGNCLSEGVIQATAYPREPFRQLLIRGSTNKKERSTKQSGWT
jgi:hypothetical protein